jgi:hypothetical protein
MGYWLDDRGVWIRFPVGAEIFFCTASRPALRLATLQSTGYGEVFPLATSTRTVEVMILVVNRVTMVTEENVF